MLLANEETYKRLSTFENKDELNEAVRLHRQSHELNDTERAVLDVISQYACKFPGVCYLSKNKIATMVGRVRRTIIRICQRLEALGIIKQYETKRDGGDRRQSTNVIVILAADIVPNLDGSKASPVTDNNSAFRNSEVGTTSSRELKRDTYRDLNGSTWNQTQVTPDMSRQEAPSKNINNNTYKETYLSADEVIKRGLRHAIPASIFDAMAPFFDGQTLYNTYGILLRAKASIDRRITVEEYGQAYIDAFMNVVRLYKAGKVRNFDGLLYSAWQSVTAAIKRRISADKHPFIYDWLNA